MTRSFVALPVPQSVRDHASALIEEIRRLRVPVRCPSPEGLHLTLAFLGDIEESDVAGIQEILETAAHAIAPFTLQTAAPGAFPARGSPRVVWLGISPDPTLMELHDRVRAGLSSLGFRLEDRPFQPHLTLARVKERKGSAQLSDWIATRNSEIGSVSFEIETLKLYQSLLRPAGARYRALATVNLGRSS